MFRKYSVDGTQQLKSSVQRGIRAKISDQYPDLDAVLDTARDAGEAWTRPLGDPPRDPRKATAWRRYARTVAAYRDRYGITGDSPLGPVPDDAAQKIDRARAEAALRQLASQPEPHPQHRPSTPTRQGPSL